MSTNLLGRLVPVSLAAVNFSDSQQSGWIKACTCTVTEYHYHNPPAGSPPYAIDVEYFSKDELLKQLMELLHAYRQYHLDDQPKDRKDREDLEDSSCRAWNTFKAAFGNQDSLSEAYLQEPNNETYQNTFDSWIDQSAPRGFGQGVSAFDSYREEFATDKECSDRLVSLTSELPHEKVARSWPYIKRVK